jgi:hypothetical protein
MLRQTLVLLLIVLVNSIEPDSYYDVGLPINNNDFDDGHDASSLSEKADDYAEFNQKCYYRSNEIYCKEVPSKCINLCNYNINFLINSTQLYPYMFKYYRFNQNITIRFFNIIKLNADLFNGLIINENLRINVIFMGNNYENVQIESFAFRSLLLFKLSNLKIEFRNYKSIGFESYSLSNFKQVDESVVDFTFDNINHLVFKQNCSNSWKQYFNGDTNSKDSDIVVYDSNNHVKFINEYNYENDEYDPDGDDHKHYTIFRINATTIKTCDFEPYSFSNIILSKKNIMQIIINRFDKLNLSPFSFFNVIQNSLSVFEINFVGDSLSLNSNIFTNIIQYMKSKFIILFDVRKSNLNFMTDSFNNLVQNSNSTIQVQLLTRSNRISFSSNTFNNVKQNNNSFIQVYGFNNDMAIVNENFIFNLVQINSCMFDLWFSNTYYVLIKSKSFNMIKQYNESVVRLSATSTNEAHYIQESYAFKNLYQDDDNSDVIYDFTPNLKFSLKAIANDQTGSIKRISLHEYEVNENDFCSIYNVTFGLKAIIRLSPHTKCSCPIYYLYKNTRVTDFGLEWLKYTPYCYQNHVIRMDDLDLIESNCGFNKLIRGCSRQVSVLPDEIKFANEVTANELVGNQTTPSYIHITLIVIIAVMLLTILLFVVLLIKLNRSRKFIPTNVVNSSEDETKLFTAVAINSNASNDDVRTSLISDDIYDNMI